MSHSEDKKVFLSYSHEDKELAGQLAEELARLGENVWFDDWEILPGDSLVDKIFEEGLVDASAFVVILSAHSLASDWVRHELDIATVRRIEKLTRVIPALAEEVEIPQALRALRWVDLRRGVPAVAREIRNAVHGISSKPAPTNVEPLSETLPQSVSGLSRAASAVALHMVRNANDSGQEPSFSGPELREATGLTESEINDAVEELEERGAARVLRVLGTGKFTFYQIEPTHVTFWDLASRLEYDPSEDLRVVAATIVGEGRDVRGPALQERTSLLPGRVNRAVAHLDDHGLADVSKGMGTFPYSFRSVAPNRRTRQFVDEER